MIRAALALSVTGAALLLACGTDAAGVDACRKIEESRCRRATGCGVDLEFIKHTGTSAEDAIQGCVRYYHEACLHGLVAAEPAPDAVTGCQNAVTTGSCDVVKSPETATACAWLIPPPPTTADAGAAPASDAAADAAAP